MAEIFPFRGFRYASGRIVLDQVVTQPYDKITAEMQARYYAANPYNLIPVEKGRTSADDSPANNVYTRAARKLEEWIAQGILVRDSLPAIYVYSQEYCIPGTQSRRERRGFIALGRLEDYSAGVVYRHEQTLSGPKADRLELLLRTHTQTGQLFLLYDDPAGRVDEALAKVAQEPAPVELRDEYGVTHRLWPITDALLVQRIVAAMADKKLVIADGHHRYETALAYRDQCRRQAKSNDRNAPYEMAMMTLFNTRSKGLTILPTHRVVANIFSFDFTRFRSDLAPFFDWYGYPFASDAERREAYGELTKDMVGRGKGNHAIGAYAGDGAFYLFLLRRGIDLAHVLPDLSPRQRQLDVVLLHRLMLERGLGIDAEAVKKEKYIRYEREMNATIDAVDRRQAQLACLLNPVRIEQVMDIALAGEVLPQKSTDFYPKLLSGLVIYRMDGQPQD